MDIPTDNNAKTTLLIDVPLGWAALQHDEIDFSSCIIFSDNRCPTYVLDLIDLHPRAIVELGGVTNLNVILKATEDGSKLYPVLNTPLTLAQRRVVRLIARGLSNKAIAKKLDISEQTVKNTLSACYQKIGLDSRVALSHYYYGSWHLIDNWTPPAHIQVQSFGT